MSAPERVRLRGAISTKLIAGIAALGGCAVGILVVFGFAWGSVVFSAAHEKVKDAEVRQAQVDLWRIRSALDEHMVVHGGRYPNSLAELGDWEAMTRARTPVLDPWGNSYQFVPPKPGQPFPRVVCLGSDGKPGGTGDAADILDDAESASEGR